MGSSQERVHYIITDILRENSLTTILIQRDARRTFQTHDTTGHLTESPPSITVVLRHSHLDSRGGQRVTCTSRLITLPELAVNSHGQLCEDLSLSNGKGPNSMRYSRHEIAVSRVESWL
ncbi:hypothetical protein PoB_003860000 [Plakobranchus ocellatus]|uniref:Uncharacterized protein n=1 Tax=Plakobranchus ocellatus TaxID=259542 RepID=A0AAV4AXV0_9GAST|nr:hypothetical protein PoB_003860000 [Plakobranchus ocellatus]